jgi:hypothetical protein
MSLLSYYLAPGSAIMNRLLFFVFSCSFFSLCRLTKGGGELGTIKPTTKTRRPLQISSLYDPICINIKISKFSSDLTILDSKDIIKIRTFLKLRESFYPESGGRVKPRRAMEEMKKHGTIRLSYCLPRVNFHLSLVGW